MTNKLLIILFVFASTMMSAQIVNQPNTKDSTVNKETPVEPIYTYVEQMPNFPGGEQALMNYVSQNIVYPKMAVDSGIQGKVIVDFVVNKEGKVMNSKVIRGIGYCCDEEALRVVNAMPLWKPGKQNGKEVNVNYKVPIRFTLK